MDGLEAVIREDLKDDIVDCSCGKYLSWLLSLLNYNLGLLFVPQSVEVPRKVENPPDKCGVFHCLLPKEFFELTLIDSSFLLHIVLIQHFLKLGLVFHNGAFPVL